jgi:hypothetical protein
VLTRGDPNGSLHLTLEPGSAEFHIPYIKARSITLDIDNEDNAPLIFDKVEASQKERYLLAWLEPGKYELLVGNMRAQQPRYDLKYFVDTVSKEPAAILPGGLIPVNVFPPAPVIKPKDRKGVYLWTAILAVLVLLIWLSFNMLRSINQTRQKEGMK